MINKSKGRKIFLLMSNSKLLELEKKASLIGGSGLSDDYEDDGVSEDTAEELEFEEEDEEL